MKFECLNTEIIQGQSRNANHAKVYHGVPGDKEFSFQKRASGGLKLSPNNPSSSEFRKIKTCKQPNLSQQIFSPQFLNLPPMQQIDLEQVKRESQSAKNQIGEKMNEKESSSMK